MATTGITGLDATVEKTNIWLKEIAEEMGWQNRERAYLALRAVLQTLRDRLTVEEAIELGAQLPMLIRGLYYEGWSPAGKPVRYRTEEEFLWPIREAFRNDPDIDPKKVAQAVFKVLDHRVAAGEINDIRGILPKHLRDLWEQL